MPVDPVLAGGAIKLSFDAFRELLGYFGKAISKSKLDRQVEAAWRELVKGDASDDTVIESALDAAKAAGDNSPDRLRLEQLFRASNAHKKGTKGNARKKAAGKRARKNTRTRAKAK